VRLDRTWPRAAADGKRARARDRCVVPTQRAIDDGPVKARLAAVLAAATSIAHAQPAPAPHGDTAPGATDRADVESLYQQAISLLVAGRLAAAADAFERVAATTTDPVRQTTALELGRQLRLRIEAARPAHGDDDDDGDDDERGREGRYAFLASTALLGLGLYGPTLPLAADVDEVRTFIGLYMLAAGGTFFGSYLIARDRPITWGVTDAWIHGATRGGWHGYALLTLARGDWNDESEPGDPEPDESPRDELASVALGSLAEGTAAALLAHYAGASPGLTNAMTKASDFGSLAALGLTATVADDLSPRAIAGSTLLGGAVGYGLGYAYAQRRALTWGDSEALRAATLVGVSVAASTILIGEIDDTRAVGGLLTAGGITGLVLGDVLLRGRDFSPGQGVVTELSTLAGGLVGAGLGYLVSPDDGDAQTILISAGLSLGVVAGFAVPYLGFDTRPRARAGVVPATSFQLVPAFSTDHRGLAVAGTF